MVVSTIQRADLFKPAYVEAQANYASFVYDNGKSLMSLRKLTLLETLRIIS